MSKKKKGKKGRKEAFDPEKDTGILRPVDMTIAAGEINDRYSDYPSRGLNPVKLASILRDADEGNVRSQMELFEEMEEKDAHLFSQMQTRKLAVTGLDWEVQPFSPDDEQDKAIAEWIKDQLLGIENLDDILTDLLDAIGKGVSIMEIVWGVDSDGFDVIEVCTSEKAGVGLGDRRHAGLHRTVPERHTLAEEQIRGSQIQGQERPPVQGGDHAYRVLDVPV